MGQKDPRIDAYIASSGEFARPILERFRALVHGAVPEVVETMKWGMPHFEHHGLLAGMAAFRQHCTFGFWKGALVTGDLGPKEAMGSLGRITSLRDVPPARTMRAWLKRAAALNESGEAVPRARKHPKPPLEVPPELARALARNARARRTFDGLSPSRRREYVEWLVTAKTEATRERRLATTLAQLAEGKSLHWKYERAPRGSVVAKRAPSTRGASRPASEPAARAASGTIRHPRRARK